MASKNLLLYQVRTTINAREDILIFSRKTMLKTSKVTIYHQLKKISQTHTDAEKSHGD